MASRSFTDEIDRTLRWSRIQHATVAVTEGWARRVLRLKKDAPLVYRKVALSCIGSAAWREREQFRQRDIVRPSAGGGSHVRQ